MGVYEGYQFFRRIDGKIYRLYAPEDKKWHGSIHAIRGDPKKILINSGYSIEDQVKSLIHEFLHLSRRYREFLGCWNRGILDPIEKAIGKETEEIYRSQPRLVKYLTSILNKADL